jgi:hypothetical protein
VCTGRLTDYLTKRDHKQPRVLLADVFKGSPQLMFDVLLMSTLDRWPDRSERDKLFVAAYDAKEKHPRE